MRHPLYETFRTLISRGEKEVGLLHPPSFEGYVAQNSPPSSTAEHSKMGCLVLAGGEGTRLGLKGPKGCVAFPPAAKKSLFQMLFEKVKAKGAGLPLSLMTSPLNHEATVAYLEQHNYFGLTNLDIFQQGLMPICDDRGELLLDTKGRVIRSPNGNGRALSHLYHSGIWKKWREQGVKVVQILPVDNPLAEPFDLELLAHHQSSSADLVLKCIRRESSKENVGVVDIEDSRLVVREYSEIPSHVSPLSHPYGNSGIFSCSVDFVEKISSIDLPWHLARKRVMWRRKEPQWIWKFETFIFDIFPTAQDFKILVSERKQCFAPLKTFAPSHGAGGWSSANTHIERINI